MELCIDKKKETETGENYPTASMHLYQIWSHLIVTYLMPIYWKQTCLHFCYCSAERQLAECDKGKLKEIIVWCLQKVTSHQKCIGSILAHKRKMWHFSCLGQRSLPSNAKMSLDKCFSVTDVWISGAMRTSGIIRPLCVAELLTRWEMHSGSWSLSRNGQIQIEDGHE